MYRRMASEKPVTKISFSPPSLTAVLRPLRSTWTKSSFGLTTRRYLYTKSARSRSTVPELVMTTSLSTRRRSISSSCRMSNGRPAADTAQVPVPSREAEVQSSQSSSSTPQSSVCLAAATLSRPATLARMLSCLSRIDRIGGPLPEKSDRSQSSQAYLHIRPSRRPASSSSRGLPIPRAVVHGRRMSSPTLQSST